MLCSTIQQAGKAKSSTGALLDQQNVQLVVGDLLSMEDCRKATQDVSIIYHLAAGIEKSFAGAFMNSALTTRNLMDAFLKYGQPKRFVNVSSFAVYSNLKLKRGALLDETCPLEDAPQQRFDPYGYGKLKQDQLVMEYGRERNLPYVIVRPGAVFGPGKPKLSGRVGIDTFGFLIHLGGSNPLPLTYVDNCAEAIVLAGLKPGVEGEIFNVVDDDAPTSKEFLRELQEANRCIFSFHALSFDAAALRGLGKICQGHAQPASSGLQSSALLGGVEGQPLLESESSRSDWAGSHELI